MKNRRKKYSLKRKVWIESEMMESEIYRSLSGKAMWVVQRFHQKMHWEKRRMSGSGAKQNFYEKGGLHSPTMRPFISVPAGAGSIPSLRS